MEDPREQHAQAALMIQRRLLGASIAEISQEFRVSTGTVSSRLQLARETILPQAQSIILEKLLPIAVGVFSHAMTDEQGDPKLRLKAARDVLFGVKALETQSKTTVVEASNVTLEMIRAERARKNSIDAELVPQENNDATKRLGPRRSDLEQPGGPQAEGRPIQGHFPAAPQIPAAIGRSENEAINLAKQAMEQAHEKGTVGS